MPLVLILDVLVGMSVTNPFVVSHSDPPTSRWISAQAGETNVAVALADASGVDHGVRAEALDRVLQLDVE
jgi:hypothetical protein